MLSPRGVAMQRRITLATTITMPRMKDGSRLAWRWLEPEQHRHAGDPYGSTRRLAASGSPLERTGPIRWAEGDAVTAAARRRGGVGRVGIERSHDVEGQARR